MGEGVTPKRGPYLLVQPLLGTASSQMDLMTGLQETARAYGYVLIQPDAETGLPAYLTSPPEARDMATQIGGLFRRLREITPSRVLVVVGALQPDEAEAAVMDVGGRVDPLRSISGDPLLKNTIAGVVTFRDSANDPAISDLGSPPHPDSYQWLLVAKPETGQTKNAGTAANLSLALHDWESFRLLGNRVGAVLGAWDSLANRPTVPDLLEPASLNTFEAASERYAAVAAELRGLRPDVDDLTAARQALANFLPQDSTSQGRTLPNFQAAVEAAEGGWERLAGQLKAESDLVNTAFSRLTAEGSRLISRRSFVISVLGFTLAMISFVLSLIGLR